MPIRTRLSSATAKALLHYDGRSGLLTWRVDRSGRVKAGSEAGTVRADKIVAVAVNGRIYAAHRLIWLMMTGNWPEGRLTFRDRDPQNLRWNNITPERDLKSLSPGAEYMRRYREKRRLARLAFAAKQALAAKQLADHDR